MAEVPTVWHAAVLDPESHDACVAAKGCTLRGNPSRLCPHHEMHGNQWGLPCLTCDPAAGDDPSFRERLRAAFSLEAGRGP